MPKAKYGQIYRDLKEKIETGFYSYQEMLPSEHGLVLEYDCSRNTVRRALAELTAEGYVQPHATARGFGISSSRWNRPRLP